MYCFFLQYRLNKEKDKWKTIIFLLFNKKKKERIKVSKIIIFNLNKSNKSKNGLCIANLRSQIISNLMLRVRMSIDAAPGKGPAKHERGIPCIAGLRMRQLIGPHPRRRSSPLNK